MGATETRDRQIMLRVTSKELELIDRGAKKDRISRSKWIRRRLPKHVANQKPVLEATGTKPAVGYFRIEKKVMNWADKQARISQMTRSEWVRKKIWDLYDAQRKGGKADEKV